MKNRPSIPFPGLPPIIARAPVPTPCRPAVRRLRSALAGIALGGSLLAAAAAPARAPGDSLEVLHWWTSASEHRAAEVLVRRLAAEQVEWRDAAIPGGAGLGAGKVLRSRVLAGDPPDVTQVIGMSVREWADMGLLLELDSVARAGGWAQVLFPTVYELIGHRQHVVAAPLGIHRINTLFYNRRLFARHRIAPPAGWADLEAAARQLRAAGVPALALSSEAWQVATLFENLVLVVGGPAFHRELFSQHSLAAAADPRLLEALERLRALKGWAARPVAERPWTEVLGEVVRGEAAMLVMGDWAKGELREEYGGAHEVGCIALPGSGGYHLYSVDTLSMFAGDYRHAPAQETLARLLVAPATQAEYNGIKGSVPVRRDTDPARLDACARASWSTFAQGEAVQAPSLVHRMATDEGSRDAIIAELHRYFVDDALTPAEAQRRLVAVFRALRLNRSH